MHPDDLAARGMADGALVTVTSRVGAVDGRGRGERRHDAGRGQPPPRLRPPADGVRLSRATRCPGSRSTTSPTPSPRPLRQRRAQRRTGHRGAGMIEVAPSRDDEERDLGDRVATARPSARPERALRRGGPLLTRLEVPVGPRPRRRSTRRRRGPARAAARTSLALDVRSGGPRADGGRSQAADLSSCGATNMLLDLSAPVTAAAARDAAADERRGVRGATASSSSPGTPRTCWTPGRSVTRAVALEASEQSTQELLPDGTRHAWASTSGRRTTGRRRSGSCGWSSTGRAGTSTTSRCARSGAAGATGARCSTRRRGRRSTSASTEPGAQRLRVQPGGAVRCTSARGTRSPSESTGSAG